MGICPLIHKKASDLEEMRNVKAPWGLIASVGNSEVEDCAKVLREFGTL